MPEMSVPENNGDLPGSATDSEEERVMSEFECVNGHLMKSGEYSCSICGARIGRMDGMTRSEAEAEDRDGPDEGER